MSMTTRRILADMHTHTVASGHAFSTVHENLIEAQNKYMMYLAVTDHFYYPENRIDRLNEMARLVDAYGVKTSLNPKIISGVEGNISHCLNCEDAQKLNQKLKWRLVGFHSWFLDAGSTNLDTVPQHFLNTILCPDIYIKPTAFAHIERHLSSFADGDDTKRIEKTLYDIVDIAVDNDIMLEINESSLHMDRNTVNLMKSWVSYAKKRNAKFCLGTDAHYCENIGKFTEVETFIDSMDLHNSYILNYDEKMLTYLSNNS